VLSTLLDLGYDARLAPKASAQAWLQRDWSALQVDLVGWSADMPLGSNFPGVMCSGLVFPADLCDSTMDRQAAHAYAVEGLDPFASNALWAEIDRELVDQARIIPITTGGTVLMVSDRVHSYQASANGVIYKDQFWVESDA
jgi:hypothetical protein